MSELVPILVGSGLAFAEGINFDRDGTLYCVDVEGGAVWRKTPEGPLEEWVRTGGRPNGSRFGPGGDLFVADYGCRAILRITTASGDISIYADEYAGERFQGPNDLCFGPDDTLYFTDPGTSSLEAPVGGVYAVSPRGDIQQIDTNYAYSNGIMVSPDGATLVVAETYTGILHRYNLLPAQRFQKIEPLVTLSPVGKSPGVSGPDGMVYGDDANLYVAHYGTGHIQVITPRGTIARSLPAGGSHPTNVAFWEQSLYVTEGPSGSIYCLDIGVGEQRLFSRPW